MIFDSMENGDFCIAEKKRELGEAGSHIIASKSTGELKDRSRNISILNISASLSLKALYHKE
ncbi:MAG TPA: hypothetical protein PK453_19360 [Leptospiraceae bacterium]|nr:hypothetical protein [Leptospiraceae bacterium]HNI98361.1 hypothetical protein [Leptospiraceae bacterium]